MCTCILIDVSLHLHKGRVTPKRLDILHISPPGVLYGEPFDTSKVLPTMARRCWPEPTPHGFKEFGRQRLGPPLRSVFYRDLYKFELDFYNTV